MAHKASALAKGNLTLPFKLEEPPKSFRVYNEGSSKQVITFAGRVPANKSLFVGRDNFFLSKNSVGLLIMLAG